jgi:hypothetical protein
MLFFLEGWRLGWAQKILHGGYEILNLTCKKGLRYIRAENYSRIFSCEEVSVNPVSEMTISALCFLTFHVFV